MTLYLKYRPQTVNELDLKEVREELSKIIKSKKIPHAFLFSGPKGTGKTSAARILAKVVNCELKVSIEPCNKCSQCISITKGDNLDVVELDAASHRGIDDVRSLRDAVKLSPARAKKKVYIIDEAHMLTTEASNALLKTLEEPPEHVIFILATTNPEKLIETIRSRAVNINFAKASEQEITRSLERVVKGEKLKAEEGVLKEIAKASDGSFRDAIKTLEQLATGKKSIQTDDVKDILYAESVFNAESFLKHLSDRNTKEAIEAIERASKGGVSAKNIIRQVMARLREGLLAKLSFSGKELEVFEKAELIKLVKLLEEASAKISTSVLEHLPLEIAVIEFCEEKSEKNLNKVKGKAKIAKKKQSKEEKEDKVYRNSSANNSLNGFDQSHWSKVLGEIKGKNTSTEALLRAAKPVSFDGKVLTLGVYYRFHKEKLEANPHRDILEEALGVLLDSNVRVVCTLAEPPLKSINKEENGELEDESGKDADVVLTEGKDKDIIKIAEEIFGS